MAGTEALNVIGLEPRCIYEYDAEHTIGGKGFKEEDTPNFTGSFYSDTKGMVEKVRSPMPSWSCSSSENIKWGAAKPPSTLYCS